MRVSCVSLSTSEKKVQCDDQQKLREPVQYGRAGQVCHRVAPILTLACCAHPRAVIEASGSQHCASSISWQCRYGLL